MHRKKTKYDERSKTEDTRTYEESAELSGYVMDLQEFDKLLTEAQKDGSVTIEKNIITRIEGKVFQLS